MANPQTENGHIDIANEIAEYLARFRISGEEYQVLWTIWRKTYGWHKKYDCISLSQFFLATNMKKPSIIRAIHKLESKNIISKKANKVAYLYQFNKDFDSWKPLAKKLIVSKRANAISKKAKRSLAKELPTKENYTKETITKETKAAKPQKEWSYVKTIKDMATSEKDNRMWIIALYWVLKGFNFSSREEYQSALRRELRPAKEISAYPKDRIKEVMMWLKKNADFKWTIETINKYINEDLNKLTKNSNVTFI
jgi:phage replication O-like protein O